MNATDDRELERYLQGGDALSRAYAELKSERPTPALDQAVLAQAKAALRPQRHARGGRFFGWPAMTAIAATVLLSFTLVMRVMLESEAPEVPLEGALTAPAASAPAPVTAPAAAALKDQAPASTEDVRSFAPPKEPSSIEKRRQDIEAEIRAASESGPTVDESTAQDAAAGNLEQGRAAAQADVARAAVAPEPAAAPEAKVTRERLERSRPASPEYSATGESSGLRAESLAKKEQLKPPKEWLDEIERLRASGETEAADRELERFKQAYPGYLESQASPADR